MERQGRSYIGFQIFPGSIFLGVVLAVLLLSVNGWGACRVVTTNNYYGPGHSSCPVGQVVSVNNDGYVTRISGCFVKICYINYAGNGQYPCGGNCPNGWEDRGHYCTTETLYCSGGRCEVDSLACVSQGNSWRDDPSASCGKSCGAPCPESVCDAYRQRCEQDYKGIFTGNCVNSGEGGAACCHGYCDICGGPAVVANYNEMKDICCNKRLMAPPKIADFCLDTPPLQGGCGVYQSTYRTNGENWACHDPNQSKEMMDRYTEECFGTSSSSGEGEGSSSSGGGSSGGDGSSSGPSPYPEGCDECPWLDSILDTLTAQKKVIEDIKACVYYPALCNDDGEQIQIDTSLLPYIRPFMDSSIALTQEQLRMLVDLDTNILKILAEIKDLPQSDTAVKLAVDAMSSNIEGKLTTVNTSVVNMNDSTKKWLRRLADSLHVLNDSNGAYIGRVADKIGVSTDSLVKHLDSIKERIPSAVLDSILKYQKLAAESSDSIVLGDLPSIDSLIDSTVRYWKELREYDSVHHAKISDSLGTLHDAIDDISWRMGVIMGYGDTASSNLRGDINAVEGAVNVFRDSSLYYWRQSLSADSAYRVQFGNAMETINGTTGAIVINQDTANARLGRIGDAIGSIDGKLGEGSYDTSSVYDGYLNGYDTSAVNFTNDLAGALNVALQDSSYANIFGSSSSVGSSGSDGSWVLPNVDSAHQVLRANVDSSLQSITANMENIFDTLRREFVLVNWDSAIIAPLGMKVPNTNTCPEDCFAINLNSAGGIFANMQSFNWGLCRTYPILGGLNVMQFIRLVLRIVTAFACVYIGMWFIAGKRD